MNHPILTNEFNRFAELRRRLIEADPEIDETTLRRNSCFDDQALHAVMIDVDGIESSCHAAADPETAIAEFIAKNLPPHSRARMPAD